MQITANVESGPCRGKSVTFSTELGTDLATACTIVGGDGVFAGYIKSAVIAAQATARRALEAGHSIETIQTFFQTWKPGVRTRTGVNPDEIRKSNRLDLRNKKGHFDVQFANGELTLEEYLAALDKLLN